MRSPNETKNVQEVSQQVVNIEAKLLQNGLKGTRKGLLRDVGDQRGPPETPGAKAAEKLSKNGLREAPWGASGASFWHLKSF